MEQQLCCSAAVLRQLALAYGARAQHARKRPSKGLLLSCRTSSMLYSKWKQQLDMQLDYLA